MSQSSILSAPAQRDTHVRRPSPVPLVSWMDYPTADYPFGVVLVSVGSQAAFYDVSEIDCQFPDCRAFHLVKRDDSDSDYHVCLSMTNPNDHTCECQGFLRHGHCRHVTAAIFVAATPKPVASEADEAEAYRNKSHEADPDAVLSGRSTTGPWMAPSPEVQPNGQSHNHRLPRLRRRG